MLKILEEVSKHVQTCSCDQHQLITIEEICLQDDAIVQIGRFLRGKQYTQLTLVCDMNTYRVAGERISEQLRSEAFSVKVIQLIPNEQGDILADEVSIAQILTAVDPSQIDCLLAIGAGTIHDIVRFVASRMSKPFLSVPTAPSVDGFTSMGAPLIIRGEKKTIKAVAPIAVFADLKIIVEAPKALIAAGFSDMLAKYTSLMDWKFSHSIAGEPYCEAAAQLTQDALERCIIHKDVIARGEQEGIEQLMRALIVSGLAMLIFGQSHPASGAEHHLSHFWEMRFITEHRKQLLHGAKVGVATIEILRLYHAIAEAGVVANADSIHVENDQVRQRIKEEWTAIKSWISQTPSPEKLTESLMLVGAPTSILELGIASDLLQTSLQQAYAVRNRFTLLRAYCTSYIALKEQAC